MVSFSEWSAKIDAEQLVRNLNNIVSAWDNLALEAGVEKIKVAFFQKKFITLIRPLETGFFIHLNISNQKSYMCVCGCPDQSSMHAETLVTFAVDMLRTLKTLNEDLGTDIHIRIGDIFCLLYVNFSGINTGPVVAGVIGTSKVFYDIWGPAGIKL